MSDHFYENAVFYFASERRENAFRAFCDRFGLKPSSTQQLFDVVDHQSGDVVYQVSSLADILDYLNSHPDRSFDFYLEDESGSIFTFSYGPEGYHVMSLPYERCSREGLAKVLEDFRALYGWGAGEDSPPPTSLHEIQAAARSVHSPFLRYRDGQMVEPDEI